MPPTPSPAVRYSPVGLLAAAALVAGSGLVHLAVVPEHWAEYRPFGGFFLVVGVVQLAAACAAWMGPTPERLLGVAVGQAALVALWVASRTTGLPVGPEPWQPEDVGAADIACVAVECLSVLVLAGLAWRGPRVRPRHPMRTLFAGGAVLLVVAVVTFVGVGAGLSGMPEAFSAAPPDEDQQGTPVTQLVAAPGPAPVRDFTLTAAPTTIGGRPGFAYNGTVPGPLLRVRQGDRVRVTLVNHLPVATTLHWHGIRVPAAEDGVAGITQDAVAPGASFSYAFVADEAGTFWYHSHQDTGHQVPAGLFGALVVDPAGGAPADVVDRTVLLHNSADGAVAVAVDGTTGDEQVAARPGQRVRLRIIDAVAPGMDGTAEAPMLLGAPHRIVAIDGRDLVDPTVLGPRRLVLGMGQRADLEFTMPLTGAVRLVDSRVAGAPSLLQGFFGAPAQATETVTFGAGPTPAVPDPASVPIFDPLTYGRTAADPTTAQPDLTAPVVLAEGPGFHDGTVQLVHTINGSASPAVPPITVRQGQLVRLHLVNGTGEFHPMHLHGHVMTVLSANGRAPTGSPLHLDTVLLGPHETVDVAFRADNPGIWMLHCHVLLHATMGMSMTINYVGVTTPFTMGARSENTPE
jgi:FtsP/CotA-like multicopper oxidase with cupredoxin domain